jgi:hypothetical protein
VTSCWNVCIALHGAIDHIGLNQPSQILKLGLMLDGFAFFLASILSHFASRVCWSAQRMRFEF